MAWFSPQQHNPENAFVGSSLPEGNYPVHAVNSGLKGALNNANNGMLFMTLMIDDGPHKGSQGNITFNLFNENQQAREIAAKQFAAVCSVVGIMGDMDGKPEGVELWNKPFIIEMAKQTKNPEYNEVKGVWDMNGNAPKFRNPAPSSNQPNFAGDQHPQLNFNQPMQQPMQQPFQTGGWQGGQTAQQPSPSFQGGQPSQNPAGGGNPSPGWQQQPQAGDKPSWSR